MAGGRRAALWKCPRCGHRFALGYGHHFRITAGGDLNPALAALIAEAYADALRPPARGPGYRSTSVLNPP